MTPLLLSRRTMLSSAAAFAGLTLLGGGGLAKSRPLPAMTMHRGPGCGCCLKWADAARAEGFTVEVVDDSDVMTLKSKVGVPPSLLACHTTLAGDYVIEGHVPFDAVKKLFTERPSIRGIGVPGMPMGSPGMEHGDGHDHGPAATIDVWAFDSAGKLTVFG